MSENEMGWSVSGPARRTNPEDVMSNKGVIRDPVSSQWEVKTASSDGKFVSPDPAKAAAEKESMDRTTTIFACVAVAAVLWFVAWLLTPNNDSVWSQMAAIEHGYLAVTAGGVFVLATIAVMRELKR